MTKRRAIIVGDKTTHGGTVIQGSYGMSVEGNAISLMGDLVACPQCKGNFPIIQGTKKMIDKGKGVALEGMKTACGAILLGSQNLVWVDDDSFLDDESYLITTEQNSEQKPKEITELYWSYGDSQIKLSEHSRHYSDVNLHIVTKGYQEGERVEATIEYDTEIGAEQFSVSALVGDDGIAVVENVFDNKMIFIEGGE